MVHKRIIHQDRPRKLGRKIRSEIPVKKVKGICQICDNGSQNEHKEGKIQKKAGTLSTAELDIEYGRQNHAYKRYLYILNFNKYKARESPKVVDNC